MLLDLYLILTTGICINAALEESKGFQKMKEVCLCSSYMIPKTHI